MHDTHAVSPVPMARRHVLAAASGAAVSLCWPAVATPRRADRFATELVRAARRRTLRPETYDGTYRRIAYPMGDVPDDRGVCTDVVVRAYRALGIDLQVRVHEDMRQRFDAYPRGWGLTRPDPNIDHRRVPNLQTFFARSHAAQSVTTSAADFAAGDLVTWRLPGNLPHIGIVSDRRSPDGRRPLVIHNIGAGSAEEDMLFAHPVTGRYRYRG